MAKSSYKIPAALDVEMGDMEITLQSSEGIGSRPTPIKTVLAYVGSGILCFYLVAQTFVGRGGVWSFVFVIAWIAMTMLLLRRDATDLSQYNLVPTALEYIPFAARHLSCRTDADPVPFEAMSGVWSYDGESGLITWRDGQVGYAYMVTGSASALLFDQDKDAILDHVDNFWKQCHEECEYVFVTTKESQKVYSQLEAEAGRCKRLMAQGADPDLIAMCDTRFACLRDYVGGTFRSVHQYMLLRAPNEEVLHQAVAMLKVEVESSSLFLKRCRPLYGDDVPKIFSTIYKGKESV